MQYKILFVVLYLSVAITAGARVKRVIGGSSVECGTHTEVVRLLNRGQFTCTAVIISPSFALTAAHCVEEDNDESYRLEYKQSCDDDKPEVAVTEVHINEEFNITTRLHDIAIVKFDLILVEDLESIPPLAPKNPRQGTKCDMYGYGITSRQRQTPVIPEHLKHLEVTLQPADICQKGHFGFESFTKDEGLICTSSYAEGISHGDSGGPLLCDGKLVGIAVFTSPFGHGTYFPDAFTSVPDHLEWINSFLEHE